MKKHTKRIVSILKEVIKDMDNLKAKGIDLGKEKILAYTTNTTTPDIQRHDVEMMIKELECECSHPNGMFTECFAPETCCPDQLLNFTEGGKHVTVNCQNSCVHHLQHKMTRAEEIEETLRRR